MLDYWGRNSGSGRSNMQQPEIISELPKDSAEGRLMRPLMWIFIIAVCLLFWFSVGAAMFRWMP